jgi:hypothetical protein
MELMRVALKLWYASALIAAYSIVCIPLELVVKACTGWL